MIIFLLVEVNTNGIFKTYAVLKFLQFTMYLCSVCSLGWFLILHLSPLISTSEKNSLTTQSTVGLLLLSILVLNLFRDSWMASLTRWTWVWVNSGSWWWTGRPGVLQIHGVTKSRTWLSNWTELNWALITMFNSYLFDYYFSLSFLSDWTSMKNHSLSD